jgi:hypothetical protein
MRADGFQRHRQAPIPVRVSRPLRDLLRGSPPGLVAGARLACELAATAPGEWVKADPGQFLSKEFGLTVAWLHLRVLDQRLDLHVVFCDGTHATAIGRRVIMVVPKLQASVMAISQGEPLCARVDAPFFQDAKIVIQRVIHRHGDPWMDMRCRCPSDTILVSPAICPVSL